MILDIVPGSAVRTTAPRSAVRTTAPGSAVRATVPGSAVRATVLGSAVRTAVEERPFQGRVTNEVETGFSPCGRIGYFTV